MTAPGPACAGADGPVACRLAGRAVRAAAGADIHRYVPVVAAAVTAGTRRAYGSYWNRVVEHWVPERSKHQRRVVAALYDPAGSVPCDREAVLAGGLRGSEQGAALAAAGLDPDGYFLVSVDVVLREMARRSLISGRGAAVAAGRRGPGA